MALDWLGSVATVIVGIGGFFLGGLNERRRDERAFQREEKARTDVRRDRREDERHEFQLANYLALQDALRRHMRATVKCIYADRHSVESTGKFAMLPPGLSEKSFKTAITFSRLLNRVVNDELRGLLGQLQSLAAQAGLPPMDWRTMPKDRALNLLDSRNLELASKYEEVSVKLGELLRQELNRVGS